MEELMTIQMTPQEYEEYRNYQKLKITMQESIKQKDEMIASLRDQYYGEFKERQSWSNRAIKAEKKLEKLLEVVHSNMPSKLRLETLSFEIEEVFKDDIDK